MLYCLVPRSNPRKDAFAKEKDPPPFPPNREKEVLESASSPLFR